MNTSKSEKFLILMCDLCLNLNALNICNENESYKSNNADYSKNKI